MQPMTIEGNNLGERHKYVNKLVKEAVTSYKRLDANDLYSDDLDVHNLVNIDVANEKKDVDYILKVLTCNDMLYVTRAIKNCSWLVCDDEYAHIVNPEYLNSKLYPHMQSKAIVSFKKLLRDNINDESRAEEFYQNEQKPSDAMKWLPKCSVQFIEQNFNKHFSRIESPQIIKRLCEKSIIFLEMYIKCKPNNIREVFQKTLFLIHEDVDKYLDIVESQPTFCYPNFGKRATTFLMRKRQQRILDKFGDYCVHIDTPTFVKYIKKNDLNNFLLKQAMNAAKQNNELNIYLHNTRNWDAFINAMPKDEIFNFIKKVFIDELEENKENNFDDLDKAITMLRRSQTYTPLHYWYRFLSFDLAFTNIKSLIGPETYAYDKNQMLETLIISADGDLESAKCILQYFKDKHMNASTETKSQFVNNLITKFNIYRLNKESWNHLEIIVNSMEILNNTESNTTIIEALIIYKILNNEILPDELEKAFKFNSLKTHQTKLAEDEKEIIYNFLEQFIWKKIADAKTNNIAEFEICIDLIKTMLTLLKDWEKNIIDYPQLLDRIKYLLKIKNEKSWTVSMSSLYNLKKSWRKYMFDESVLLSLNEEVCINCLKHGPNLLKQYKEDIESLFVKDSVSLMRLLRKVRIYWPQSLSKDWKEVYLKGLEKGEGHNALTKGLCYLLPRSQLLDLLRKYTPMNPKIDWSEIKENELNFQRYFAKNMHRARPQSSLDTLLWFSQGDYLQYALPSLLAIYYNSSSMQFQEHLPKLLDTPVSLQKHGVRFAFLKLPSKILKETFRILWKKTQNVTIRNEIFLNTHKLLCKEENSLKTLETWALLEMFIDNLTLEENKTIYKLLYTINGIPNGVKPSYLMKSYNFLKTLIANNKQEYGKDEWDIRKLARQSKEVMELLPSHFVANLISTLLSEQFFEEKVNKLDMEILSSYLLCAKDEGTQLKRYEEIFKPIQHRSFEVWNKCQNGEYYAKINYELLIYNLIHDLKTVAMEKNMVVPEKLFSTIQMEMERSLPLSENYILLRTWQLATQLVHLLVKDKPVDWEKTTLELAPEFGRICQEYLKSDTVLHFPCIYILFTRALEVFKNILSEDVQYEIYKCFVQSEDFIPGYLAALKLTNLIRNHESIEKLKGKIRINSSIEVQMHYYDMFKSSRASLFTVS